VSWSNFERDGAAAFKLSERSPVQPALSAKQIPVARTRVLNVLRIRRIDLHPATSDEDGTPNSISDTENWLDSNGDFDYPKHCEDDWEADNEHQIELENAVEYTETPELGNVDATLDVPELVRPTRRSKKKV